MSLPREVESAIDNATSLDWGWQDATTAEVRRNLEAAIERAIADAVKPWRDLVERGTAILNYGPLKGEGVDQWYEDARALLEKKT